MNGSIACKAAFRLYVVAQKPSTAGMIEGVRQALTALLGDEPFQLEVFDVVENPRSAFEGKIKATPTLVRVHPLPEVRLVGDMKNPHLFARIVGDVGRPLNRDYYSGNQ
jgi:circadian clock protein KaiB